MNFGIDQLVSSPDLQKELEGRKLGLVGNPASVTAGLEHSMDALIACDRLQLAAAFGPQHGMKGDKQDNMVESEDYLDPASDIPVHSLYGATRRPTDEMLNGVDLILFDLQTLGCRIYTFITTLKYFLEACHARALPLWVLDRPNPIGRQIEGLTLRPGEESFVGCDEIIMRYGLTIGELATWLVEKNALDVDLKVIPVSDYDPGAAPGFGWPVHDRPWINPSPNASSLNMARCFSGTVMIEGTTLSEGRGTTTPLEIVGAPDLNASAVLATMADLAPGWMQGAPLRACWFEPGFHKHSGSLCQGIQFHTDSRDYQPDLFKPYRIVALLLKTIRQLNPGYELWSEHEYEYEGSRLPIDVINGGPILRTWVDDPDATVSDLDKLLTADESSWQEVVKPHLIY